MIQTTALLLLATSVAASDSSSFQHGPTDEYDLLYADEWSTTTTTSSSSFSSTTNTSLSENDLPSPSPPLGYQPNFVFVLTDDQDRILGQDGYDSLGSLTVMPTLREKLLGEGAVVENFLVNTPICCPSRTEFFTGRYFHNVGPPADNKGTCMHADTRIAGANTTGMFGLMKNAGYNVGVFGKVTNDQARMLKQLGDSRSATFIDSPIDYNNYMGTQYWQYYDVNQTHQQETLSPTQPVFKTAYQTTQIGNRTLRWLSGAIAEAKKGDENGDGRPFFAYVGPHAPHFPAQPAPWHERAFDSVDAPVTPNYNVASPGKAQHVRQNPPLDAEAKCWENQHFRDRWASLLSVDDILNDGRLCFFLLLIFSCILVFFVSVCLRLLVRLLLLSSAFILHTTFFSSYLLPRVRHVRTERRDQHDLLLVLQ
jgi:N-acetylglucosamine-6-sulfatase